MRLSKRDPRRGDGDGTRGGCSGGEGVTRYKDCPDLTNGKLRDVLLSNESSVSVRGQTHPVPAHIRNGRRPPQLATSNENEQTRSTITTMQAMKQFQNIRSRVVQAVNERTCPKHLGIVAKPSETKGQTAEFVSAEQSHGSAQESNLPKTAELPRTDFEDRGWHQPTERFHSLLYLCSSQSSITLRVPMNPR